jgi:hypothetical protein
MPGIQTGCAGIKLGNDWNQQRISLIEQREKIGFDILKQVLAILKISVEAIRNFNEEKAANVITNTFNDKAMQNAINNNITFHPIDKPFSLMRRTLPYASGY